MKRLFRKRLKVIEHNLSGIMLPDDPSYPYKVIISRDHPEFHRLPMTLVYGSDEYLVMRAASLRILRRYVNRQQLRADPLLNYCVIAGPQGQIESFGSEV